MTYIKIQKWWIERLKKHRDDFHEELDKVDIKKHTRLSIKWNMLIWYLNSLDVLIELENTWKI